MTDLGKLSKTYIDALTLPFRQTRAQHVAQMGIVGGHAVSLQASMQVIIESIDDLLKSPNLSRVEAASCRRLRSDLLAFKASLVASALARMLGGNN